MSRVQQAMVLGTGCLLAVTLACEAAPLDEAGSSPNPAVNASQAPASEPLFEQFQDVNPCTGQVVTYTFTGTARVRDTGAQFLLVASGTVGTSDGYTGSFNRQFVITEQVAHFRFHDSEVSDATGQRILFGVGLAHEATVDGNTVTSFEHFSGLRCVGRP
jgi:hypothetical protein